MQSACETQMRVQALISLSASMTMNLHSEERQGALCSGTASFHENVTKALAELVCPNSLLFEF